MCSGCIVVGIVTRVRVGQFDSRQGRDFSLPNGVQDYFHSFISGSGVHIAPYSMGNAGRFLWSKASGTCLR